MLKQNYAESISKIFAKYPDKRSAVMPLLYIAQEAYGYVNDEGVAEVAELCEIDPVQVRSIAGFYTMYSEKPKGKYWLQVCTDLACALCGADKFHKELKAYLGVSEGGTTEDGMFTVEHVMCLGACDRAPMLQNNFHFVEKVNMDKMTALIEQWRADYKAGKFTPTGDISGQTNAGDFPPAQHGS
jgi:NADH-quinone oxidoreductase E subunit